MPPPGRLPEKLADHLRRRAADKIQRGLVHLHHGAVQFQQTDKLEGVVEDGGKLPFALAQRLLGQFAFLDFKVGPLDLGFQIGVQQLDLAHHDGVTFAERVQFPDIADIRRQVVKPLGDPHASFRNGDDRGGDLSGNPSRIEQQVEEKQQIKERHAADRGITDAIGPAIHRGDRFQNAVFIGQDKQFPAGLPHRGLRQKILLGADGQLGRRLLLTQHAGEYIRRAGYRAFDQTELFRFVGVAGNFFLVHMFAQFGQSEQMLHPRRHGHDHALAIREEGLGAPGQIQIENVVGELCDGNIYADHPLQKVAGVDRRDAGHHPPLAGRIQIDLGPHRATLRIVPRVSQVVKIEFGDVQVGLVLAVRFRNVGVVAIHRIVGVQVDGDDVGVGLEDVPVQRAENFAARGFGFFGGADGGHRGVVQTACPVVIDLVIGAIRREGVSPRIADARRDQIGGIV